MNLYGVSPSNSLKYILNEHVKVLRMSQFVPCGRVLPSLRAYQPELQTVQTSSLSGRSISSDVAKFLTLNHG